MSGHPAFGRIELVLTRFSLHTGGLGYVVVSQFSNYLRDRIEPFANYVDAKRVSNLVFLGGHSECEKPYITGKVGADRTAAEGYLAAGLTALCLLASLKAEIGDLDKVVQIVKVNGLVNDTEEFKDHSKVFNGCSDLLVKIFGGRGRRDYNPSNVDSPAFPRCVVNTSTNGVDHNKTRGEFYVS